MGQPVHKGRIMGHPVYKGKDFGTPRNMPTARLIAHVSDHQIHDNHVLYL